jgi:3'(2'), 5'-bisphosphate nucleotidase
MLQKVLNIARLAGEEVLRYYGGALSVDYKVDASPLTQADRASDMLIRTQLGDLFPDVPVLSEESDRGSVDEWRTWKRYWLVDPLDGTKEFIKQTGEFTINIALIDSGRPVLGVVYVPVTGLTYYAEKGDGAHVLLHGEEPRAIRTRAADPERMVVVVSRDHAGAREQALIDKISHVSTTSMGSSLKFCLVAEGKADLYPRFGRTLSWDTAAAQCVVEEAGGLLLDLEGRRLGYDRETLANPFLITVGDPHLDWRQYID